MSNKLTIKTLSITYVSVILFAGLVIGYIYADYHNQKAKKKDSRKDEIVIIPMNEDNEGRPLFTVKTKDSTYDYMYAEEIAASLLMDSIITDEMLHICD